MIDAELAAGRRLVSLGFMRRYDPAYAAIKASLDDGGVGAVLLVHCAHRNAVAPAVYTSEMLITSSAVHEIDITRWLLGEEIVGATVRAPRSTSQAPDGLRDPQLVLLETASGVLIDVEVFVNARYGYDIRCELVGETGTLRLDEQVAPDFRARFAVAYRRELEAWVRGARHGRQPDAWDGYAANAVADACLASLASGERADVAADATVLRSTAERFGRSGDCHKRVTISRGSADTPSPFPPSPGRIRTWLESSLPFLARCARTPPRRSTSTAGPTARTCARTRAAPLARD